MRAIIHILVTISNSSITVWLKVVDKYMQWEKPCTDVRNENTWVGRE